MRVSVSFLAMVGSEYFQLQLRMLHDRCQWPSIADLAQTLAGASVDARTLWRDHSTHRSVRQRALPAGDNLLQRGGDDLEELELVERSRLAREQRRVQRLAGLGIEPLDDERERLRGGRGRVGRLGEHVAVGVQKHPCA